eukprot:451123_1
MAADYSLHNVWTFMKNNKATDAASLKVLQTFVMSLGISALQHLIKTYLQSVSAQYSIDKNGLTLRQYYQKISNSDTPSLLHPSDTEILRKMNKKYGNKYNKRIMNIVQQKQRDNLHLLSVPPQIVSYSFQYLSFKEVSTITPVCCHFAYLVHHFPALCHYHIDLNRRFFVSAMRNRVHLKHLSHFKSIEISAAYFDAEEHWKDPQKYRWMLFKHILHRVIQQSLCSLHTLNINIMNGHGNMFSWHKNVSNVLLGILNDHDVLYVTNLKWLNDYFLPHSQTSSILNQINDKICRKLPYLEHFVCGINEFRCRYDQNPALNISSISRSIECTVNHYKHLKTLHLKCTKWNIYRHNSVALIAQQLTKLEELTIISRVVCNDTSFEIMDKIEHNSLQKLHTEFVCYTAQSTSPLTNDVNVEGFGETIQHILKTLFNVFSGVSTFSFGAFSLRRSLRGVHYGHPPVLNSGMDWRFLFGQLKSMKYLRLTSISYFDSLAILNQFDGTLITLDMCIVFRGYYGSYWATSTPSRVITKFGMFVAGYLLPLVKRHQSDVNATLKHLKISFGKQQLFCALTDRINEQFWHTRIAEPTLETDIVSYYDPLLELLCNVPASLQRLDLCLPLSHHYCHSHATKIVQKISEISAQRKLKNLESIRLENFKLKGDAKSFLDFFFGFENNIHREKQKLYLSFV